MQESRSIRALLTVRRYVLGFVFRRYVVNLDRVLQANSQSSITQGLSGLLEFPL